ncbi:MAG: hypothetical protein L0220_29245, partial [Acidobacteria bacterium]|nr:hypothetical protein [Acidobacteriota bacterium]
MKRVEFLMLSLSLLVILASAVLAQDTQSADEKENFITRTTLAVRYVENKRTTVNITGTPAAPRITGKGEVVYKKNDARIKLKVENLDNPQIYGPFYTTYIVWAVTPEGQAENLIELLGGYIAEVEVKTAAQTFGFIITAEPHSAVKVPSQKVVAETTLPKNVILGVQTTQAVYSADKGALYEVSSADSVVLKPDYTTPRLILGARRSLDIARRAG